MSNSETMSSNIHMSSSKKAELPADTDRLQPHLIKNKPETRILKQEAPILHESSQVFDKVFQGV